MFWMIYKSEVDFRKGDHNGTFYYGQLYSEYNLVKPYSHREVLSGFV